MNKRDALRGHAGPIFYSQLTGETVMVLGKMQGLTVMNIKRGGKIRRCYMQSTGVHDTWRCIYMEA